MPEQQTQERDSWSVLEQVHPLPTAADGYIRVLFVGTTGAGKTTLIRQFLGARAREYFPPISGGKTTTSRFEAVLKEGQFQAVVSFLSKKEVRTYIEECVMAAVTEYMEGGTDRRVEGKLLEHENQRFRLRYILGSFSPKEKQKLVFDEESEQGEISVTEEVEFANTVQKYIQTIKTLVAPLQTVIWN